MRSSRATDSKWTNRYRQYGELGLYDRSSTPIRQPSATPDETVARIEQLRREWKWSASRITFELHAHGVTISRRTITRHLAQLGLNHRRFIDPNGESYREVKTITAKHPGHMVHLDVKRLFPDEGVGRTGASVRR
ncbi:hypothetical protein GCM10007269_37220 [Microbacterium murale]|uniref:Transposase n=2 Tax=Micrococcales TaxID=85006 RepID=A0ABQ1S2N0_9MICO|nr:hypothetical protein GCM10007269_37220 [Microbacterium murale]